MRIPQPTKGTFKGVIQDLLYSILFQGECIGYQKIEVTDSATVSLTPPDDSKYCIVVIEASDSADDKDKAIRFLECPDSENILTSIDGLILGDLGAYEVKGKENLKNFRMIGIEAGKVHFANVQYFA